MSDGRVIWTYGQLWRWVSEHSDIVLTHGVFDLFHEGHEKYIGFAASCGAHLLVSLDSDASTKMRKGPNRPMRNIEERMSNVLALNCVKAVTQHVYHRELLAMVRPRHYVISESSNTDYSREIAFVRDYGGTVYVKPEMASIHTTDLVKELEQRARENKP